MSANASSTPGTPRRGSQMSNRTNQMKNNQNNTMIRNQQMRNQQQNMNKPKQNMLPQKQNAQMRPNNNNGVMTRGGNLNNNTPSPNRSNNRIELQNRGGTSPNFTPTRSNIGGSPTSTPKRGMSAKQRRFYERLQKHKQKKANSPSPIRSNSRVQVNRGMEVHYDSQVPEQEKIFDPNKSINLMAQDPYHN